MSRAQRIILSIGAFLILVALLFPPWLGVRWTIEGDSGGGQSKGYHFLFVPPKGGAYVNTSLLVIEIVGLALIVGLLFVIAKRRPND